MSQPANNTSPAPSPRLFEATAFAFLFVGLCLLIDASGHTGLDIDSHLYMDLAESLYHTHTFTSENALGLPGPDIRRTPGLPAILALFRFAFEGQVWITAFLWLQRLLWLAAVLWVFRLNRSPWNSHPNPRRIRIARAMLLFLPVIIFNASLVLTDLLYATGVLAGIALLHRRAHRRVVGPALGVFFGVLTLIRPLGLLYPFALGAPLLLHQKTRRLAIVMMLTSTILPGLWILRNATVAHAPTLSALTGRGLALHRSHTIATHGSSWASSPHEHLFINQMTKTQNPFDAIWILETKGGLTELQGEAIARNIALEAIRHDPAAYLTQTIRNICQYVWIGDELANTAAWFNRAITPGTFAFRALVWLNRVLNLIAIVMIPGYYLFRDWPAVRRNPIAQATLLATAYLLIFPALTTITYSRFALPLLPGLAFLAAGHWKQPEMVAIEAK